MKRTNWGFDVADIDTNIRPQDDFYQYAAGAWLKRNPIPDNESRWGTFTVLRKETDVRLKKILEKVERTRNAKQGSPEQMLRDFYRSGMDMKRRNALGYRPAKPLLDAIASFKTREELVNALPKLHIAGVGAFFGSGVDQDSKNSTSYILHLFQSGLGMPERDYYLKDDKESKRVRDAYLVYVEGLFRLIGKKPKEASALTEAVLRIETVLAKAFMTKEDRRDPHKTYNKVSMKKLIALSPSISWKHYMGELGASKETSFIVMQPAYLQAVSKLLTSAPLEDLKAYLTFHSISAYSGALSAKFVAHSFKFYGTTLVGMQTMKPLWRRTMNVLNGSIGELLGRLYVEEYFTPEAKKRMNVLVDDLFAAYEKRLKKLSWMSPATKKKALKKLRAMNRKIGYPDKWKGYPGLTIDPNDYAGNLVRAMHHFHRKEMKKLGKPLDRSEWFMDPQIVNAYFAPNLNDIVFPAAILQPPFFSLTADDAVNYGSIGTVIGHEITHGFDDKGSLYDEHGNLKSWWTKEDRTRFTRLAKIIEKQYSGYSVADGVKVNGKLTLGENIADIGGIAIAFDAYQERLKKTGRKDIDGLSPEQRFFLSVTLFDRENARPEVEKTMVLTDPHSPSEFRINGPLANIAAFYETYGLKKGDGLYRDPKVRTTVW